MLSGFPPTARSQIRDSALPHAICHSAGAASRLRLQLNLEIEISRIDDKKLILLDQAINDASMLRGVGCGTLINELFNSFPSEDE